MPDIGQVLVDALGADRLRPAAPEDFVDGVKPGVVILPQTVDDAAAALDWARRERLSVVVRGAGSADTWSRPTEQIDVLLSTARLNHVIEHSAGDLTVTVAAGARLMDVNALLGEHRQFLPLDPPHARWATIGGLLGTNDSGPLRHRFGTPSDLVLGVTIATADGLVAKSGGRVVKNVAGYDLARLLAGSHGALGVIVSATFKLAPEPGATGTLVVEGPAETLERVIASTFAAQLEPMAMEVTATGADTTTRLHLLFGFDPATAQTSLAALSAIASGFGATATPMNAADEPAFWQGRGSTLLQHSTVLRVSWLPGALGQSLTALRSALGTLTWTLHGRAAVGAGHLAIDGDEADVAAAIRALRASPVLGHVVVIHGARALRKTVGTWPASPNQQLFANLKTAWDPTGVLGAGRGPL